MLQENGFEEDSYAYVACMAVDRESRRTGAATALLGAAERMAGKWQQNFVLLHTYADNFPGLRLYHRNGVRAGASSGTLCAGHRSLFSRPCSILGRCCGDGGLLCNSPARPDAPADQSSA